jgi:hypothetical protein
MYLNLRVEKEGLNANVLLREIGDPYHHVPLMDDETPMDPRIPKVEFV